jgi:formate hydrogenlyase subunit 6/NADH:ubiquinone oxidoreductase subunit I
VCPSKALHDGGDRPALRFVEGNCVQCGLCHNACPEDAIMLAPRVVYERAARGEMRVLHEEAAFRCVVCGKPFATQKIIDRMMEKLSGHWMFQDEAARRRLQMCEDCRVMDMFEQGEPNVTDKPRAHEH